MADEPTPDSGGITVETEAPGLTVQVEPERGRSPVGDEDLAKLTSGTDDEITHASDEAKRMVKGLRTAYQEQRRRAEQWSRDAATASNLADQLYRENQTLRENVSRSESALIAQALHRAEAQLENAKQKHRQALTSGDADLITAASEDMARSVAEADRLKLLQPAPQQEGAPPQQQAPPPPQQQAPPPASARTRAWVEANPWFGKDQEMTQFAMRQHQHMQLDGITEESNPDLYWRTIEGKLKETYPDRFKPAEPRQQEGHRPVAVAGGTRSNGNGVSSTTADGKRVVRLNESQVRLAKRLGLTPEQYAAQLVKEEQEARRVQ